MSTGLNSSQATPNVNTTSSAIHTSDNNGYQGGLNQANSTQS